MISAGLRRAAVLTRAGLGLGASATARSSSSSRRRMALASGATVCAMTAYASMDRPAKADAALATPPEAAAESAAATTGASMNITARLSSSSSTASPQSSEPPAEEASPSSGGKATLMSHHTEAEPQGMGAVPVPVGAEQLDEEEGEEGNEEDLGKYDGVELEETDCPLCHFMRASQCGPTWMRWEKCIHYHKTREEDFVGPCSKVTLRLAQCIERHKDEFPPMLRKALMGGGGGGDGDEGEEDEEENTGVADSGSGSGSGTEAEGQGKGPAGAGDIAPAETTAAALDATAREAAARHPEAEGEAVQEVRKE